MVNRWANYNDGTYSLEKHMNIPLCTRLNFLSIRFTRALHSRCCISTSHFQGKQQQNILTPLFPTRKACIARLRQYVGPRIDMDTLYLTVPHWPAGIKRNGYGLVMWPCVGARAGIFMLTYISLYVIFYCLQIKACSPGLLSGRCMYGAENGGKNIAPSIIGQEARGKVG